MSDWTYRACDGYARVCSALGIVRPDGSPGDVDAVLSYIAVLQQRAARVHELEAQVRELETPEARAAREADWTGRLVSAMTKKP